MRINPQTRPGKPLYPGITRLNPGAHYQFTTAGHRLICCVQQADPGQIVAVENCFARFGLFVHAEVFFVLAQFGEGPCMAAHYNWWFNPPCQRPDPFAELAGGAPRVSIQAVLVDATSGVVAASQTYEMDSRFSRVLLELVAGQIHGDFDPERHLDIVRDTLRRYPNRRAMLREAVSVCSFGMSSGAVSGKEEEAMAAGRPAERLWAVPGPS